jgi:putative oxidoreductase
MKNLLTSHAFVASTAIAPIALRLVAGIIFVAHGAQKLFGWLWPRGHWTMDGIHWT